MSSQLLKTLVLLLLLFIAVTSANVDKTIFLGPAPKSTTHLKRSIGLSALPVLGPPQLPVAVQIARSFPLETSSNGTETWLLLSDLEPARRYELRVGFPATQPTRFGLETFTLEDVVNSPLLLSSCIAFAGSAAKRSLDATLGAKRDVKQTTSLLFVRITAAANYFTTDKTLMQNPPPVDVDLALDPFILNILPGSLLLTIGYIVALAISAWFLSDHIWISLGGIKKECDTKSHKE
ncbi:hypothetical protein FH972_022555 [Carpinus fangiana]|uniref:Uncharacterized protein n=1 Tax=Carpinus fangiana TaxID=176857 RepID=A0A5N6KSX1_9ROSI|nr:hypothetical protein FH972_022555 [Carpinus fangiana]